MKFHVEKATLPGAVPTVAWAIVDELFRLHPEASKYLESLRGRGCSVNTVRNYACRLALYLTWCDERGLGWPDPGFENLLRFRDWLVSTPLPPRGKKPPARPRFRKDSSADAVLVTVTEFLRFGVGRNWVSAKVAESLSQPRHLRFLPTDFETGEGGRFRQVQTRTLRFTADEPGVECFTPEQVQLMIQLARNARDRFMIVLMRATGMRIGETLGLRREDIHLLVDSRMLGCHVRGPHVHVRRRRDNVNGALAKSHRSRVIPVTDEIAEHYRDYQWERDRVCEAVESDMVFVNLYRAPLGRPMGYPNAKQMFDRLAKWAEIIARPHMLRHTAATEWVAEGVPHDVVQALLGQVSPSSLKPYLHASDKRKREAVERVAAVTR
ncbi:tyrosine-type recombinase/integrase [Streptomyces chiangmaiensis]|uniref:Tyrosine-type recombinase/integrase n=1 Tax=Streptomyces chiangmaiensis TaxID=766497 RepID=A0ABU7FQT4_9ACTN|nr:tyrosine-type recombinase/integrase [Streptomyces chiangmaiensis]MED7826475.1 tyrosine-type recombinase/integrase [Streptomyces chiangmaiensis]